MEPKDIQNRIVKNVGGDFKLINEPIPKPGKGQVLIKVAYSTVNPYDRYIATTTNEGTVLGSDGCGTVIDVGEDVSEERKGKKVSFAGGAFCNYTVKDDTSLIYLDDS